MTSSPRVLTAAALAFAFASVASGQHSAIPAGMTHEQHMEQMKKDAEMKQHGDLAMGFDQDKTTHHFTMNADGGSIAVSSNDLTDQASLRQIRSHLQDIAVAFKQGDFGKPQATHSELPPGVPVMQRLKDAITYFTALKAKLKPGGRVAIVDFRKDAPQGPPVEFRFTPDQVSAELAQAGFQLQTAHDFLPQQLLLIYRVK